MALCWMSMGLTRKAAAPAFPRRKLLLNNPHAVYLCRSFNSDSQNDNNHSVNVDCCSITPLSPNLTLLPPFSQAYVLDPFSPARSLSRVLNWVDQLMDDPFSAMAPRIKGGGPRRAWDAKEDDKALYLRMDMPRLSKDDVKVTVEQNTLIVKGEEFSSTAQDQEEQDKEDSIARMRYVSHLDLPPNVYKLDSIKAEMKNGVLRLVIPKVKDDERKDVYQVHVE